MLLNGETALGFLYRRIPVLYYSWGSPYCPLRVPRCRWQEATTMTTEMQERKKLADKLYKKYGKPLESEHLGKYLAVSPDGKTLLGPTLIEVAQQAKAAFGPGSFLFKVGPKAVGKWR